jgi:hypothetical protein
LYVFTLLLLLLLLLLACRRDAATGEVRIGIFTTRDVGVEEELTYDYMFEHYGLSGMAQGFKCHCGAKNCRWVVRLQLHTTCVLNHSVSCVVRRPRWYACGAGQLPVRQVLPAVLIVTVASAVCSTTVFTCSTV